MIILPVMVNDHFPVSLGNQDDLSSPLKDCSQQFLRRIRSPPLFWRIAVDNSLGQLFWTIVRNNHSKWSLGALRGCSEVLFPTMILNNHSEEFFRSIPRKSSSESFFGRDLLKNPWGFLRIVSNNDSRELLTAVERYLQQLSRTLNDS